MNPYEQQITILGILYQNSQRKSEAERKNYGMSSATLTDFANQIMPDRIAQTNAIRNLEKMDFITVSVDWIEITPKGRQEFFAFCKNEYIREKQIFLKGKVNSASTSGTSVNTANSSLDEATKKHLNEIANFILTNYKSIAAFLKEISAS